MVTDWRDTMAGFLWLLRRQDLLLCFIIHPVWTLSLDILLKVDTKGDCLQPVVCTLDQNSQWSSSFTVIPNDLFALAKAVKATEGDIIVTSSSAACSFENVYGQQTNKTDYATCFFNCSKLFVEERQVFLQSVHDITTTTRQTIFDSLTTGMRHMDTITKGVNSLLSGETWKTNVIFASSYEGVTAASSYIRSPESKLLLFNASEGLYLNDSLQSAYSLLRQKDLNFIIICPATCIVTILSKAYELEIVFGKTSNWLLIPTDGNVEEIINIQEHVPNTDIVIMDLVPCSRKYSSVSLQYLQNHLSSLQREDSTKHHGIFTDYIEETFVHSEAEDLANVYALHTSYNDKKIRHVGHITQDGDVDFTEDLFPGFIYGFNNRTLTVSTLEWPLFVIKKGENGSATYSGLCIDLLEELSRALNFSYRIVEPEDQEWGRVLDGKWTGLIGDVAYKKVDIVVAPISMTRDREDVLDFTIPYYYEKSGFILKKPDLNADKWMTLVAPFRYEVHICILSSLVLSTVLLFITEEVHPVNTWTDNRLSARRTRYGDILWYHFGALMANGGAYLPTSQSGRSVLSCWWLFTVISAAIYSGNLIAFLTDWREKSPFSTLAQMVEQDTYKWGTIGGGHYTTVFQNSSRPVNKKVWHGLQSDPEINSLDPEVHKRKVLEGKYAFLADVTIVEGWRSEHCDLQLIREEFLFMNYAIALPNNSAYTSLFTMHVLRIIEMGLPDMWYRRWSSVIPCVKSKSAKRVDLLALQSAFYSAGIGVLLALCVLLTEVLCNRKCRHCDNWELNN